MNDADNMADHAIDDAANAGIETAADFLLLSIAYSLRSLNKNLDRIARQI